MIWEGLLFVYLTGAAFTYAIVLREAGDGRAALVGAFAWPFIWSAALVERGRRR